MNKIERILQEIRNENQCSLQHAKKLAEQEIILENIEAATTLADLKLILAKLISNYQFGI